MSEPKTPRVPIGEERAAFSERTDKEERAEAEESTQMKERAVKAESADAT